MQIIIKLFIFLCFSITYTAALNRINYVNHKLESVHKLYSENNINIYNNEYNIMSDSFVYIIIHHYYCDDPFYEPYDDLHRIYKTDKEAFRKIRNIYANVCDYHFKVIKYKINNIPEYEPISEVYDSHKDVIDHQISEVLYDSYKHIINEQLEVIKREIEQKEEYLQVRRLYHWVETKQ